MVPGGQGGFHVWVKYRVTGAGAEQVFHQLHRAPDQRRPPDPEEQQLRRQLGAPGSEGYWESPVPIPAFMCPSPLGMAVQDQPLEFDFEVRDPNGALRGGATATFTPHCPTDDQATHCVAICNG